MSAEKSVSPAVIHMLDGGLVPTEEEQAPLRRVELAAIWQAEADAELDDAIYEASAAGFRSHAIAEALGISSSAVRSRLVDIRARRHGRPV